MLSCTFLSLLDLPRLLEDLLERISGNSFSIPLMVEEPWPLGDCYDMKKPPSAGRRIHCSEWPRGMNSSFSCIPSPAAKRNKIHVF